jgi:hypothetical protein
MSPAEVLPPEHFIAEARGAVRRAHQLLLEPAPRNLDLSTTALAVAVEKIRAVESILINSSQDYGNLLAPLMVLCEEQRALTVLLENAAAWHANLLQEMLKAAGAEAAVPAKVRRVHVEA